MSLAPLPPPGAAIFPQFTSSTPTSLTMKGRAFSTDFTVTTITYSLSENLFLSVGSDRLSWSHRKHLTDSVTGHELCELRREKLSRHAKYIGVDPTTGTAILEIETGWREASIKFINNAAGGEQDVLEYRTKSLNQHGEVTYRGDVVAVVEKKKLSLGGQYDLQVSPGLDPFLVVVLVVAMDDKARTNASVAAAGGGVIS